MKVLLGSLVVLLAAACSAPPAIDIKDSKPTKDEFKGVASFKEKMIPGIAHYQRAAIAFAKFRDLDHRQKERHNPLARNADAAMPDEIIEQKKNKHLKETEEHLERMFEVNKDYALAHQVMGLVHYNRKEYDEALVEFREVLRIDPLSDGAWVNIAYAHHGKGEADEAKEAIAEALKVNPQNRYAIGLRTLMENEEEYEAKRKAAQGVPPFRPKLER